MNTLILILQIWVAIYAWGQSKESFAQERNGWGWIYLIVSAGNAAAAAASIF